MGFRITGLPAERFSHLFALSDAELAEQGAVRQIADARDPGYPCRNQPDGFRSPATNWCW